MDLETAARIAEIFVLPAIGALAMFARFAYSTLVKQLDELTTATRTLGVQVATQNGRVTTLEARLDDHIQDDRAHVGGF